MPLKETAIQQHPQVRGFDEMLTTGDFAGGTKKRDLQFEALRLLSVTNDG